MGRRGHQHRERPPRYEVARTAAPSATLVLVTPPTQQHGLPPTGASPVLRDSPGWVKTDLVDGAKTSVWLATLPDDGPTGGFFHMRDRLPW